MKSNISFNIIACHNLKSGLDFGLLGYDTCVEWDKILIKNNNGGTGNYCRVRPELTLHLQLEVKHD